MRQPECKQLQILPEKVNFAIELSVPGETFFGQIAVTLAALDTLGVPCAVENVQEEPIENGPLAPRAVHHHSALKGTESRSSQTGTAPRIGATRVGAEQRLGLKREATAEQMFRLENVSPPRLEVNTPDVIVMHYTCRHPENPRNQKIDLIVAERLINTTKLLQVFLLVWFCALDSPTCVHSPHQHFCITLFQFAGASRIRVQI